MKSLIRRLWNSLKNEIVETDPWEPELPIGKIMLREKIERQFAPGRVLGVFDSAEELSEFLGTHPAMNGYWVTIRRLDGSYESADRRHLWHLLANYEYHEPTISFAEAEAMLAKSSA